MDIDKAKRDKLVDQAEITQPTQDNRSDLEKSEDGSHEPDLLTTAHKPSRRALPSSDMVLWRRKMHENALSFDDRKKQIYLDHIAANGLKGRAAMAAGVGTQTVADHVGNDPEFKLAVQVATDYYRDSFVDHAMSLAYEGVTVKKYNRNGELVEERKDYPIRLIEMELKRVEPEYRDKQELKVTGQVGVLVAPATLTPTAWAEQAKIAADVAKQAEIDMDAADVAKQTEIDMDAAQNSKKV